MSPGRLGSGYGLSAYRGEGERLADKCPCSRAQVLSLDPSNVEAIASLGADHFYMGQVGQRQRADHHIAAEGVWATSEENLLGFNFTGLRIHNVTITLSV